MFRSESNRKQQDMVPAAWGETYWFYVLFEFIFKSMTVPNLLVIKMEHKI